MWQVSGRSETTFDEYKRLDLYYVDNWSLAHDARIVLRTFVGRDGPTRRPLTTLSGAVSVATVVRVRRCRDAYLDPAVAWIRGRVNMYDVRRGR